ncbi:MAG: SDR family NAD(P)-dependent oxidoreductase [Alphaproteobacteria bacterium]
MSFDPRLRAVVLGSTGGIGEAVCDALGRDERVEHLYAGSRGGLKPQGPNTTTFSFDLCVESSIAEAAEIIGREGSIDLIIVATGELHGGIGLQPDKSWSDYSSEAFARAFEVNATGPAIVAKHFMPLLARRRRAVFAALSARVGSIEDNRLGGWTAYRASKAALHQIIRSCAIELGRRNPSAVCVALHPGTVDSRLSAPFQRGVAEGKLFMPEFAAAQLLRVIDDLKPGQTGQIFAWDGERIPF